MHLCYLKNYLLDISGNNFIYPLVIVKLLCR